MICPNPQCQRIVSSYDTKCSHCGTALQDTPVKKYLREVDRIVESRQRSTAKPDNHQRTAIKQGYGPRAAEASVDEAEVTEDAIRGVILEQAKKLPEIQSMIFMNPHILTNAEWSAKAKRTGLYFDWENDEVNACAGALEEGADERYLYLIKLYGGYINFAYAVASAYSAGSSAQAGYDMDRLGKVIRLFRDGGGRFGIQQILSLMPEKRKIASYGADAFKVVYECIAHELGHICYGHVYGLGYDFCETEANIGQEFDADSFAYAVIASSTFKEELWWGLIQYMIVGSALEILAGRSSSRTHPLTTDRLKTAISRFPDLAAAHNVSVQWAEEMALQLRTWLS